MPLPNGFTAIRDATTADQVVSIIGIIISFDEPKKSRGEHWVLSFTLQDDFTSGSVGDSSSITCRLFRHGPEHFPKITGAGDVAIIRRFKLSRWGYRMDCCGSKQSDMLVFPASTVPDPAFSQPYQTGGGQRLPCQVTKHAQKASITEQMAVIHLKHASSDSKQRVQQHATITAVKGTTSKKESLIKDLEINRFYSVHAQVVNVYYYPGGGKVDLKVTDYTENRDMFLYAEPEVDPYHMVAHKTWKGPFGYLVLNVTLFEENANWAQDHVSEGDYIYMRNMRVKMSQDNKLEGVLHQDKENPQQVDIRLLKNLADIEAINKRREAYEKGRGSKTAFDTMQNAPKKSSAKASRDKKQARKERKWAEKEAEQRQLEKKEREWEISRSGVNANIRAAFPEMKLSTISEIIYNPHREIRTPVKQNSYTLPFVNCRHRSRVRVVDVFPPELQLFAHSTRDPTWTPQQKQQDSTTTRTKERWEWGFVLLLEDAEIPRGTVSEKLRVVVNNDTAQYLLKMNAADLKAQPDILALLEQKLFILWGNLMELKTELTDRGSDLPLPPGDNRLQNKPFDACIEEYGCEVPITDQHPFGYQRMHLLAQTTIQYPAAL
ncbi:hypothetical protein BDW02DRAFT_502533 [Decorospora gaudefroyi]|uniref:Protection of telomeres protein 1 n=1 Tax=Decorospora gaudefroyi TaxID=184978 RepID=A0A6A5K8N6_9PLEO|nr:hypothetical protein BDW02DRAFT_502533 [Decorospora gaudefroyi]